MTETTLERVLLWEKASTALADAKVAETIARDALINLDFVDRVTGTNTKPLPDGRVLKCIAEIEVKATAEDARACIAKLEALGDDGKLLADRLFKWTPEVRVGELKKLPPKMKKIADKAMARRDRRPSIRVETPAA